MRARRPELRPREAARREARLEAVLRIVAQVGVDAVTHRRAAEEARLPLSSCVLVRLQEAPATAALGLAEERDTARLLACASFGTGTAGAILEAALAAITDPLDESVEVTSGFLTATYALLLEASRRLVLRHVAERWTGACLLTLGRLLDRPGSRDPRVDEELLLGAANGLLLEQVATGATIDLRPKLGRLAGGLVGGG